MCDYYSRDIRIKKSVTSPGCYRKNKTIDKYIRKRPHTHIPNTYSVYRCEMTVTSHNSLFSAGVRCLVVCGSTPPLVINWRVAWIIRSIATGGSTSDSANGCRRRQKLSAGPARIHIARRAYWKRSLWWRQAVKLWPVLNKITYSAISWSVSRWFFFFLLTFLFAFYSIWHCKYFVSCGFCIFRSMIVFPKSVNTIRTTFQRVFIFIYPPRWCPEPRRLGVDLVHIPWVTG